MEWCEHCKWDDSYSDFIFHIEDPFSNYRCFSEWLYCPICGKARPSPKKIEPLDIPAQFLYSDKPEDLIVFCRTLKFKLDSIINHLNTREGGKES